VIAVVGGIVLDDVSLKDERYLFNVLDVF
jgi:hypothetical protein